MNKFFSILAIVLAAFVGSCIQPPSGPADYEPPLAAPEGAFVLCEGLWGMDNSSLSRLSLSADAIENNFYMNANSGARLGDLGSDIVVSKNFALIAVTGSALIEKIDKSTGASLGRLKFVQGRAPRKLVIINDTLAAATDLFNHSICFFNPVSMEIIKDKVPVGPAPEGIALAGDVLLVANSGYGDYLAHLPKAGTVSIVSIGSMAEVGYFFAAANPIEILVSPAGDRFYLSFNHLPSLADSVGGIIEYDLQTLKVLRKFTGEARSMTFSLGGDSLVFIGSSGVEFIDLAAAEFRSATLIANPKPAAIWYSVAISPSGDVWVGNARNYQSKGEILFFSAGNYSAPANALNCGVNPNRIYFY